MHANWIKLGGAFVLVPEIVAVIEHGPTTCEVCFGSNSVRVAMAAEVVIKMAEEARIRAFEIEQTAYLERLRTAGITHQEEHHG